MSTQNRRVWLLCIVFSAATVARAATLTFQPPVNYPVGTAPLAVAVGDFNGDGALDLAVVNASDGSVSVLLGHGDGTFEAAMNFSACNNCNRIATGDFNADGKSDLAVLRPGDVTVGDDGDLSIFLSNGDGMFVKGPLVHPGKNPSSLIVADVDADHKPDLLVCNATDGNVAVLLGLGDGSFQVPIPYATGASPSSILLVDFDRDGVQDLAIRRLFGTDILLANGNGTFRAGPSISTGLFSSIVSWADFNQDGNVDYLLTGCNIEGKNCTISLALGNGDGTFQSSRSVASFRASSIAVKDFDGDGNLDIVATQANVEGQLVVLRGNGDGTFQPLDSLSMPSALSVGMAFDLNQDKAPDLVSINSDNNVGVLLNTGTDFSISVSDQMATTLSPGQTASAALTVTLLNAFDNPVVLACSVQPTGAGAPTCSVTPDSVAPEPNGKATATLTINSTPSSTFTSLTGCTTGASFTGVTVRATWAISLVALPSFTR